MLVQDNVLISNDGIPRICDFGMSRMLAASRTLGSATSGHLKGSARWLAIELLQMSDSGSQPVHTLETDVWAFGMTIHVCTPNLSAHAFVLNCLQELLTKEVPYARIRNELRVMLAILKGDLPPRPASYDSWSMKHQRIWNICSVCWSTEPVKRATMDLIVSYLIAPLRIDKSEGEDEQGEVVTT